MNLSTIKKEAYYKPPFFISYLITDPKEYGNNVEDFTKNLTASLSKYHVDMICFRDKETKDIVELAKACLGISKQFKIKKILINSNIDLALQLGFDGVHFPSHLTNNIIVAKQHKLYTIVSCHNEEEIILAKINGANAITYSPIFYKEFKGKPKGIQNLKQIIKKYQDNNFKIIALGGIINKEHINMIKNTNANGFASIRYFKF